MFGNHDYETAQRIAREKSRELGKTCVVMPAYDDNDRPLPDLYTVGVEIEGLTGGQFRALLANRLKQGG